MRLQEIWKIWTYTLGSFNDEKTKKYDDIICTLRSIIFIQLVVTNCFIIAGNIRHWEKQERASPSSDVVVPNSINDYSLSEK